MSDGTAQFYLPGYCCQANSTRNHGWQTPPLHANEHPFDGKVTRGMLGKCREFDFPAAHVDAMIRQPGDAE